MFKVLIAPDKFRGSLTAGQAASALARGVRRAVPDAVVDEAPMADGGEGTVEALVAATLGTLRRATVAGPLGAPVEATYGVLGDGRTAVIEMAAASGLALVPADCRDPARASTRGTGELVLIAARAGALRILLGIGGSASTDGGAGLAQALGYRLLDADGRDLGPGGGALGRLDRIDATRRDPSLDGVTIDVACDVANPLCGPTGAALIYGPQKGAGPELAATLDTHLDHFARVVARDLGVAIRDVPGAGAAGGLGGGLLAFASGRLGPGVALVIEAVGLADRLRGADLCLTGEGALDGSSAFGKTAVGVGRLARSQGCSTLALAGTLGPGVAAVLDEGITAYFSLCDGPLSLAEAIARAPDLLERAAEQAVRGFLAGRRVPPQVS